MIVVTGGAGFIGSNLLAALEASGQGPLVVCDRLRQADKWRNIAKRELAAVILPEQLDGFLETWRMHIRLIVHLGAVSATTERDADLILRSNIQLTLNLWDWCARHGVRFIYASSAAVYGDGAQGFRDDADPAALAALRPLNPYGWSKLFVDRRIARLLAEGATPPPQWAGLRFFNVYGPNEFHKADMMSVVCKLYPRAAMGESARLFRSHRPDYADGGQLRDFIHVDDCVAVVGWLIDNPAVSGLFNCGTGTARSFADLASAVFRAVGREPRLEFVDTPADIRARYQYFTQADTAKLRAAGFQGQFTPLERGVESYVAGYLAAADPYR